MNYKQLFHLTLFLALLFLAIASISIYGMEKKNNIIDQQRNLISETSLEIQSVAFAPPHTQLCSSKCIIQLWVYNTTEYQNDSFVILNNITEENCKQCEDGGQ